MNTLEIENLSVEVGGKKILKDITLHLPGGETMVFFGPNGSGKTTLMLTIAGMPEYKVTDGKIVFNGEDITSMKVDERAKRGLGVGFQLPPEIIGVKLRDMVKICGGKNPREDLTREESELIERFNLGDFINRDLNSGFSGGERKRAEMLQLLAMKPVMLLLDEPDSGVDVGSLRLVGRELQNYLDSSGASALIITHHGNILEHIKAETACVMMDGRIWCRGDPGEIYDNILEKGYRGCVECEIRHPGEGL
ncbi:MAG: Fe-S cluster assembly ATPase SufC [Candidatus Altiarchaeales archaeon ex4484_2]|nr:MAG: Fe-S cluster assembly ATPase SufC [Candidatus Altiarchaeales archaeon ex4484_2]